MIVGGSSSPAGQQLGDDGPAVPQLPLGLPDDEVLLQRPAALAHRRVQVLVPALATLLPAATLHSGGDERPVPGAILQDQSHKLHRK